MEGVPAFAIHFIACQQVYNRSGVPMEPDHTQSAIITGIFACRTGTIELDSTYTANIVLGLVPSPGSYCIPLFDGDLHGLDAGLAMSLLFTFRPVIF